MDFDNTSPIWSQLVSEFRRQIATGVWAAGERIPSTRELALKYRVNPNTVQRALQELDRLGYTQSERTAGRTVTAAEDTAHTMQQDLAAETIAAAIAELKQLGLSKTRALEIFEKGWEA